MAPVVLMVCWNLWNLRATLLPVAYLDDASLHEQMVRFATRSIQLGHNPLTAWFPYLGEGSPQFLHYQSLGAIATGLIGTIIGADSAFRWSMYLLIALWPLVIYASARLMRIEGWAAAVAAVLSSLIVSVPGVGYERGAYLWIGYGLWAQLWASWTLPLAWAFTWRCVENLRFIFPATLFVAATCALHFETGYLALLGILLFPLVADSRWKGRYRRAAALLGTSLLASAWVTVPLVAQGKWAATNEVLSGTPLENGYGAKRILSWLFTGDLFDAGRIPILTVLVLIGVVVSIVRWRVDPLGRALVTMFTVCMLLAFGRTTFGGLVGVVPGSSDLFFRRFLMGSQLTGMFLAGIGTLACARFLIAALLRIEGRIHSPPRHRRLSAWVLCGTAALLAGLVVFGAMAQVGRFDSRNSAVIHVQSSGEAVQGAEIAPLLSFIAAHGGGRTYAGLPTNWGSGFTVGVVPVFKYLESKDIDEVGYTLRTASLMTDPEYYFDQGEPSDFELFGVRYLILPASMSSPIEAVRVMRSGPYTLWTADSVGYLDVVEPVGVVRANRSDVATRTLGVLRSSLVSRHEDLEVSFPGTPPLPVSQRPAPKCSGTLPPAGCSEGSSAPGTVVVQPKTLVHGTAGGVVRLSRTGVVMLSASFDPGWRATVDGRQQATEMLAPAVVGVPVGPGVHRVVFHYVGFAYYPELLLLAALILGGTLVLAVRRPSRSSTGPDATSSVADADG